MEGFDNFLSLEAIDKVQKMVNFDTTFPTRIFLENYYAKYDTQIVNRKKPNISVEFSS